MDTKNAINSHATDYQANDNEQMMLSLIQDIILKKDREDIARLKNLIENQEILAEKISPIVEIHIETLKRRFPREYQKQVERIIDQKLKSSQDELLDVIYPIMGTMVRKYVAHQFLSIRNDMENRIGQTFALKNWIRRFKISVLGMDPKLLIQEDNLIEEVYVIERDSGILLGHHALQETMDRDLIAGMLTAIKSFVEDAFRKQNEELEMIDYGQHKIFIQTFQTYYISIVLDGMVTNLEKDALVSKVLHFATHEMSDILRNDELTEVKRYEILSHKLAEYFQKHEKYD